MQSDYVHDQVSGLYYNSSGDCYDPWSNLYWFAATGKWYYYNEATNTYDEYCLGVNTQIARALKRLKASQSVPETKSQFDLLMDDVIALTNNGDHG
ncbi:hypothetical protein OROMI_017111 [Orobanche minor]